MNNNIILALNAIDVAALTNTDWIIVGMALKAEGFPCSVWDNWSKDDTRYRIGACESKWETFKVGSNQVTGETIMQMAMDCGWTAPAYQSQIIDGENAVETDSNDNLPTDSAWEDWTGWADWDSPQDWTENVVDNLPAIVPLAKYMQNPPAPPEELISGILRYGQKLLLVGPSKAGKSFLLMELCVAIAEGLPWLGFPCKAGNVLYINLEIAAESAINRFVKIYEALNIPSQWRHTENIAVWNLRGHAEPLDQLMPKLLYRIFNRRFDAIVIDPIYKVITGDENSATAIGAFCNLFDTICAETGSSVIYCHHHSKGAQGFKRTMDRASGSGVFARDADALLDIIPLEISEDLKNKVCNGSGSATAYRMGSVLREFPNIKPVNFWFHYPLHQVDMTGELSHAPVEGSRQSGRAKNSKNITKKDCRKSMETAFQACSTGKDVTLEDLAAYLGVTERTVRNRLKELPDRFEVNKRVVTMKNEK